MNDVDLSKIRAYIFDMDGLMFNTEGLYKKATADMARAYGKVMSDETHVRMMGRSDINSLEIFAEDLELNVSAEELSKERIKRMIPLAKKHLRKMPGLEQVFDKVSKKGLACALVTGSPRELVNAFLTQTNLKDVFSLILTGNDVLNGKPAPDIYQETMKRMNLQPGECLVFEDSLNGVKAAKAAGCLVFAVPNEFSDPHEYTIADRVYKSLIEASKDLPT